VFFVFLLFILFGFELLVALLCFDFLGVCGFCHFWIWFVLFLLCFFFVFWWVFLNCILVSVIFGYCYIVEVFDSCFFVGFV